MAENTEKKIKKVDEKPDKIDTHTHAIKYDDRDKLIDGMSHSDEFKKKYGEKWRIVANAIAHMATHHLRTKRDR